ncbi:MAG: hypothetical protein JSS82_10765 [Bacteroidetes bacterium]|nr:hypothetical protein [Bacteroidota bacterium]
MTITEVFSSIITGVISSILVVVILGWRDQKKWNRTKRLFLSKMNGTMHLANYDILTVLNINPTYEDTDTPKSFSEICDEVLTSIVSEKKFAILAQQFENIIKNIENLRAQALIIPTYMPKDYHSIDKSISILKSYTSAHYFYQPLDEKEDEREELEQSLKEKIVAIYSFING